MKSPRVSVAMPTYNGERFIADTIRSILAQTYAEFELVVVDDGSTDRTAQVVESFDDSRIRLIRSDVNGGIAVATNRGYAAAKGEFIAQMDHDDLACPSRLATQVAFLDAHPDVDGCGGQSVNLSRSPGLDYCRYRLKQPKTVVSPERVACETLFTGVLFNPTIMFRARILEGFGEPYDPAFRVSADKDFIERSVAHGVRWAILPDLLLRYRRHSSSASRKSNDIKLAEKTAVANRAVLRFVPDASEEELRLHALVANRDIALDPQHAQAVRAWFARLMDANARVKRYPKTVMQAVLAKNWLRACALIGSHDLRQGMSLYYSFPELATARFGVASFVYEWQKRAISRWKKRKKNKRK